jgi:hypothetical protein
MFILWEVRSKRKKQSSERPMRTALKACLKSVSSASVGFRLALITIGDWTTAEQWGWAVLASSRMQTSAKRWAPPQESHQEAYYE